MRLGLLVATLLAAVVAFAPRAGAQAGAPECARTVAGLDLQTATIPQLQARMAAGKLSSAQLVDAYLARIAAYEPFLNSIREVHPRAREQAAELDAERRAGQVRGPLHGIPVLLKDNVGTADLPTTAGALSLKGSVPGRDATITARLRAAGAVILGKTNLSEFANWVDLDMPNGYSSLGGQVMSAFGEGVDPLGSSTGSGVAASMALSAATIGTETSGSIISPSIANGVVGVKTTLGIASRAGILPLAPSFDVPGPMVRSVADAAVVLGAIAGADERDPATAGAQVPPGSDFTASLKRDALQGARLAYSTEVRDGLGAEERALFDAAIERMEKLGATVVGIESVRSTVSPGLAEIALIPNEFKASLNAYLAEEQPDAPVKTLGEIVAFAQAHPEAYRYGQNLLEASEATPGQAAAYPAGSAGVRSAAAASIDAGLAEGDAEAIIAPGTDHVNQGAAAGYPTVTIPLGFSADGLVPEGLTFLGPAYSEPTLLGFAYALEQDRAVRVPPTAINTSLAPSSCPLALQPPLPGPGFKPLRVRAQVRGRRLTVSIRGATAGRLRISLRRGKRIVARRTTRSHRVRFRLRRRGRYTITVLDPGPPPRTAKRRVRVRR